MRLLRLGSWLTRGLLLAGALAGRLPLSHRQPWQEYKHPRDRYRQHPLEYRWNKHVEYLFRLTLSIHPSRASLTGYTVSGTMSGPKIRFPALSLLNPKIDSIMTFGPAGQLTPLVWHTTFELCL